MKKKNHLILLGLMGIIPYLFLPVRGMGFSPQGSSPQDTKQPLRTRESIENLLIAVAPLSTHALLSREGFNIRDKIARHMEKDLGLKVLKLSEPVSVGSASQSELENGFANAQTILSKTGADLLIWGDADESGKDGNWNVYVSASVKDQCLAREEGFSVHATADLERVADADILEVLDWVTASWRGLIQNSQGMYIPKSIQPMILKTDAVLGLVAEKNLDPRTLIAVKSNLAFLLSEYGEQMKDVTALKNAVRLTRDVIANERTDPETHQVLGDMENESILGRCLFTLGNQQMDLENLEEAAKAFKTALKGVNRKYDPDNWAALQTGLGAALAELGQKQADQGKVRLALQAFEDAANLTSQTTQPHQWVGVQTGMGACYLFLGSRETDTTDLKKAIPHFLSALTPNSKVLEPDDYASAETNISMIYFTLGERERSAEEMRKSIFHARLAEEQFKEMQNDYGVGFSLANLGQAQLRLAHYTEDDQLLLQSRETLKKSQELIPQTQDTELWAKNELYLGLCQEFLGSKKMDGPTLQDASDIYRNLRSLYDPIARKPMWNELCNFQAEVEILLGNLECDSKREDGVLKMLGAIRSEAAFQIDPLRAEQIDESLGKAMIKKGVKEKDSGSLRQALSFLEEAFSLANHGNQVSLKCSCQSELVSAYAALLLLKPDAQLAGDAKLLLQSFEGDCQSATVPPDQANHLLNAAKLERALAIVEKDKDRLVKARSQAATATQIYLDHGYPFFAAEAQMELGNGDLLLGQMSGDKEAIQRAINELSGAEKTLKTYGSCWENEIKEQILSAQALTRK